MNTKTFFELGTNERKLSYHDFYRATVIDNKDKEKFGRVKIFIPDLMKEDKFDDNEGLWAWPANNPVGGRNKGEKKEGKEPKLDCHHYGTCYIPADGAFVWVWFESGNPNRPYYMCGLDISHKPVPPENQLGKEWWNKWTIMRSPDGRVIIVSDDPDDERIEITGKKRLYKKEEDDATGSVYTIDENQTVILLDERDGKEKLLIRDYKGNFINLVQKDDTLHVGMKGNLKVKIEKDTHITLEGDVNIHVKGNIKYKVDGNITREIGGKETSKIGGSWEVESDDKIAFDGSNIYLNSGEASADTVSPEPEEPEGERD